MASVWDVFKESFTSIIEIYRETFRVPCSASSLELGVETGIVTYLLTRIVFKRPQKAFKYGSTVFLLLPAVYWPICRYQERKAILESGVTVVDTQQEIKIRSEIEKGLKDDKIKIETV